MFFCFFYFLYYLFHLFILPIYLFYLFIYLIYLKMHWTHFYERLFRHMGTFYGENKLVSTDGDWSQSDCTTTNNLYH